MRLNSTVVGRIARMSIQVLRDRRAATAIEYGLILAFVVIGMIFGLTALGSATSGMWNTVSDKVANAH